MDDFCPYKIIRLCVNKFKRDRTSIEDALRSGGPKIAVTLKTINIHDMILSDRRMEV